MHKASAVMYSIANIFNWIVLIGSIAGIILSILNKAGITNIDLGYGLVFFIIAFIVAIIIISLVRKAKAKGTSKFWDVLFIILGVLSANIFYILGGIFGCCESKK